MNELKRGEPRALFEIYNKPEITSNKELAEALDIHDRHASRLARRLEDRRLIGREVVENGKKLIHLTDKGERIGEYLTNIYVVMAWDHG